MLKVLRNLKNSWTSVLIIIILLCIQATTDLALPDYTSKIVNVGIQYGGIEEAAPEVISEEDMENLLFFTDDDEQILQNYELVENEPTSYQEKVIKQYLGRDYNTDENKVYVLKALKEEQLENLVSLMIEPLVEYSVVTNEETANQIKEQIIKAMTGNIADSALLENRNSASQITGKNTEENMTQMQTDFENMSVEDQYKFYKNQGIEKKEIIKLIAKNKKVPKNDIYKLFIISGLKIIVIPLIAKRDEIYCININNNNFNKNHLITVLLEDANNSNIKIKRGEILLWEDTLFQ